jgi:hypothetical protein
MKFNLGLLLCGVVLIAAAPIWADNAPGTGSAREFRNGEISGKMFGSSSFGLNARGTSDLDIHPDSLVFHSDKFGSSVGTNWISWSREGHPGEGVPGNPAVPEPASLGLVLLGLVGVGFLGRRRGELSKTIYDVRIDFN